MINNPKIFYIVAHMLAFIIPHFFPQKKIIIIIPHFFHHLMCLSFVKRLLEHEKVLTICSCDKYRELSF